MIPLSTNPNKAGLFVSFPDVCKTPSPGGAIPIPYPVIATKARQAQEKTPGSKSPGTGAMPRAAPNRPSARAMSGAFGQRRPGMAGAGIDLKAQSEAATLRARLGTLTQQLQSLKSSDAAEWERLLEEYLLAAGALYVTLHR